MDILNSDWLINMLKKSSTSPHGRLLSLFDIVEDWLNAPNVVNNLVKSKADNSLQQTTEVISTHLQHYLTQQAALAGSEQPEMLAHQLYFMLLAAIQEAVRSPKLASFASASQSLTQTNASSFKHAKNAAAALITAQTQQRFFIKKSSLYAIAASVIVLSIMAGGLWAMGDFNLSGLNIGSSKTLLTKQTTPAISTSTKPLTLLTPSKQNSLIASPEQTAALFSTLELMRKGSCQFPEALQLPDSYKAVYMENIIGGNVSSKVADQKIIMQILQKVRCNYTPMLMENSRS